jgi:hypothetical protein
MLCREFVEGGLYDVIRIASAIQVIYPGLELHVITVDVMVARKTLAEMDEAQSDLEIASISWRSASPGRTRRYRMMTSSTYNV